VILVDADLLLYASISDFDQHERARIWLDDKLNAPIRVGLPWSLLTCAVTGTDRGRLGGMNLRPPPFILIRALSLPPEYSPKTHNRPVARVRNPESPRWVRPAPPPSRSAGGGEPAEVHHIARDDQVAALSGRGDDGRVDAVRSFRLGEKLAGASGEVGAERLD